MLAVDRTNWKLGKRNLNILMIAIAYQRTRNSCDEDRNDIITVTTYNTASNQAIKTAANRNCDLLVRTPFAGMGMFPVPYVHARLYHLKTQYFLQIY